MKGSDYMALVKRLPCVVHKTLGQPQEGPTYAHHVRTGQGMGQRAGAFCTAALCYDCHQGPLGIHGDRTTMKIAKLTEMALLDLTIEGVCDLLLRGEHGPF